MKIKPRKSIFWNIAYMWYPSTLNKKSYFSWGNTLYTPRYTPESIVSEIVRSTVNLEQQGGNIFSGAIWWLKYKSDPEFRYSQELRAYQTQYLWFKFTHEHTIEQEFEYRQSLARVLASPKYGNMVSYDQAYKELGS